MKQPVYIFGAGGLGREIKAMLQIMPAWEVAGYYDDNKSAGSVINGIPCVGSLSELANDTSPKNLIVAIGDPTVKRQVLERLSGAIHLSYPKMIHPSAILLDAARISIEAGCIITAGCILTTGISIGKHTLINLNVTIGHDTIVGDGCSVMPGANLAGNVRLGKCVLVGSGVNILNAVSVGDFSKIGAGALVIQDVHEYTTVIGVPAREKNLK